jgi:hypothetical protein
MNAHDNTNRNRLSRELSVGRYLLYNWRFAGVLYRFVPKRGSLRLNPQNRRFPGWTSDTACNVQYSLTWFEYRVAALRASGTLIPRHLCQLDRELVGACSYFAAVLVVGIGFVRHVGIRRHQQGRLRKFTIRSVLVSHPARERGRTAKQDC